MFVNTIDRCDPSLFVISKSLFYYKRLLMNMNDNSNILVYAKYSQVHSLIPCTFSFNRGANPSLILT